MVTVLVECESVGCKRWRREEALGDRILERDFEVLALFESFGGRDCLLPFVFLFLSLGTSLDRSGRAMVLFGSTFINQLEIRRTGYDCYL